MIEINIHDIKPNTVVSGSVLRGLTTDVVFGIDGGRSALIIIVPCHKESAQMIIDKLYNQVEE